MIKEDEIDTLREEVTDYQLVDTDVLPKETKVDIFWGKVSKMMAAEKPRFPTLSKLMQALMVIPHSNTSSERTFSMIRKIDTDFRSELGKDTICSLLSYKINSDTCCYDVNLRSKVLRDAKSARKEYICPRKHHCLNHVTCSTQ